MTVRIREATADDAPAIAAIRITTWRAAYAGLIPQRALHRLDIHRDADNRRRRWDVAHADPRHVDLLAFVDDEPVGWAAVGTPLDADDGDGDGDGDSDDGQLYAIYVLPEHWDAGVGRALLTRAEQALREGGFARGQLWVLAGNDRAAAFYERHGWLEDGTRKLEVILAGSPDAQTLDERGRVKAL
ncbi:GNAT family N-acetyltransferase [Microbacterium sp. Sa4CUA7]|uniref:GNAT family N-acetyltransferase n=1 Tax=Microbacterium pullorum TaxID=2762236 RepID=A0ABR8RY88_9MICO|nr:GNAT family N-acetyltransferase [Microbacterium pullorum]MBD7956202.1 GNAT family N-acetyltransferase [Microbacterium pullorum]